MLTLNIILFLVLMKFIINYKHLLVSLLSLEYLSLILFLMMFCYLGSLGNEIYFGLYFFVMVVCEGVLGLCLLVSISYMSDVNKLKSMNTLSC